MVLLPPDPFFGQRYIHILGRRKLYHVVKYTGGSAELLFFVEGLRFPDEGFSGLVSIHVSLLEYMAEVRAPGLYQEGLPAGQVELLLDGHSQGGPQYALLPSKLQGEGVQAWRPGCPTIHTCLPASSELCSGSSSLLYLLPRILSR